MATTLLLSSPWVIRDHAHVDRGVSIAIEDGRIVELGPADRLLATYPAAASIDCREMILLPGLLNGHNHTYEILCRGLGKEAGTEGWLSGTIYPMTRVLTAEDYHYGALLGAADCLRTGTTAVVSQLTNFARFHAPDELAAFQRSGIRARVVRASSTASTIDPAENAPADEEVEATREYLRAHAGHPRVAPAVGPAGLFSCDPDTHVRLKAVADEAGSSYFTHLSETRTQHELALQRGYAGQIDWAYRIGILDRRTVVAHAVWASHAEIDLLARTEATVVHNPSSNMVLASGPANIPQMLRRGVNVTLATDGPASNDSQDMIAEMKAAVLLARLVSLDPTIMDAPTAFRMATEDGARIFDLEGHVGTIAPGQVADIVGVSLARNPCMLPVFDPIAALVYYGSGRDVSFTMIDGEIVYRDGHWPHIDLDEAISYIESETLPRVRRALGLPDPDGSSSHD